MSYLSAPSTHCSLLNLVLVIVSGSNKCPLIVSFIYIMKFDWIVVLIINLIKINKPKCIFATVFSCTSLVLCSLKTGLINKTFLLLFVNG